jgi:hypothetical protein
MRMYIHTGYGECHFFSLFYMYKGKWTLCLKKICLFFFISKKLIISLTVKIELFLDSD